MLFGIFKSDEERLIDYALIDASKYGDKKELEIILKKGADIKHKHGTSVLAVACEAACEGGYKEIVEILINNGAHVNGGSKLYSLRDSLRPPLMIASSKGRKEIVELLIKHGADVNIKGQGGQQTPLFLASWHYHPEIVEILLENGADPNREDCEGMNYLMILLQRCDSNREKKCIETILILAEWTRTDTQNKQGKTALMMAIEKGDEYRQEIVRKLLEYGSSINIEDKKGMTALMIAIDKGYKEIVEMLLEEGAEIDTQSNAGITALMRANREGYKKIEKMLLKNGLGLQKK